MSELFDKPSQIQDKDLAWEVAHAEKPGRDYLHDDPLLPRDKMIEVATEIGAASMHATLRGTDKDHAERTMSAIGVMDIDPAIPQLLDKYTYTTVPSQERLHLVESPLIAEWAKIPGMKLINGRPVVNKQDMQNFAIKQKNEGIVNKNGIGSEVWNKLKDTKRDAENMEFVPEHPLYAIRELSNKLQYFDRDTAEQAGLELAEESWLNVAEYVDLFSLYEVGNHLSEVISKLPKQKPNTYSRFGTMGLTEAKAKFLSDFLEDTLHPEANV